MSQFDPNAFLNATVEGANSTEMTPVPEGEYVSIIEKVEVKEWSSRDGSASGLKLALVWDIEDDAVKSLLDMKKVTCRQDIMLDLTETGALDLGKGKNVTLGRLREATGLNAPGEPFAFSMLQGRLAKANVKHRVVDDKIYAEVRGTAKA